MKTIVKPQNFVGDIELRAQYIPSLNASDLETDAELVEIKYLNPSLAIELFDAECIATDDYFPEDGMTKTSIVIPANLKGELIPVIYYKYPEYFEEDDIIDEVNALAKLNPDFYVEYFFDGEVECVGILLNDGNEKPWNFSAN